MANTNYDGTTEALGLVADGLDNVNEALDGVNDAIEANTSTVRSLRDIIAERLAAQGVENAAGVQVTINQAETVNIISDNNPVLDRQVDPSTVQVKTVQSAGAGLR